MSLDKCMVMPFNSKGNLGGIKFIGEDEEFSFGHIMFKMLLSGIFKKRAIRCFDMWI